MPLPCKDFQSSSFSKDYRPAKAEPIEYANPTVKERIAQLNNTDHCQTIQEAENLFYMGINPRINSVLGDPLISRDMIEATRQLMKSAIEGIVIVDEGFVLNSLKQFAISSYKNNNSGINNLRTEARVIGEMQKMLVQAIQEQLIASGEMSIEDYKPVVLLSDVIDLDEVNGLFKKIASLAKKNKEVADRILKCTPPPIKQSSFLLQKRGSKSLHRLRAKFRNYDWKGKPIQEFLDFLNKNDLLALIRPKLESESYWVNEPLLVLHKCAYTIFQTSVVSKMIKRIMRDHSRIKNRVKWGFSGEKKYDELVQFLCENYAEELGLEEEDTVFRTAYIEDEASKIPYKGTELVLGQPTAFETISMAPSQASAKHPIAGQFLALMNGDVFSILENQLWAVEKNKGLMEQEAWEPSLKELHDHQYFGEIPTFDQGSHQDSKSYLACQTDPLRQTVRSEMKRLRTMGILREITSTLMQDETLKSVLQKSGVIDVLNGERPIGDLPELNNLDLPLDPLDSFQESVAEITYLRDKIERLESNCRKYEEDIDLFEAQPVIFRYSLNEALVMKLYDERRKLWTMLQGVQEEGKARDKNIFSESPEAYLLRHMAKALSGVVHQNPELAEALTQFFRRTARVLHPKVELTLDLQQSYWQVAA